MVKGSPEYGLQTQAILFLKPMSVRGGSDIERLWISMTSDSINLESIEIWSFKIQSRSMKDPTLSDIDFKHEMSLVWTTLKIFIILVFVVQFGACGFHHFLQNHFRCIWLYLRAAWLQVKQKQLVKNDNATSLVQGLLKNAFKKRFK